MCSLLLGLKSVEEKNLTSPQVSIQLSDMN